MELENTSLRLKGLRIKDIFNSIPQMQRTDIGPNSYILRPNDIGSDVINPTHAYCRCSTTYQVKNNGSIDVQIEIISGYAKLKELTIIAYYVDEAISGARGLEKRIAFKEMENTVKKKENIVCTSVSRLGRNVAFTSNFMERMKKMKVNVHITEIGDITGDQEMLFDMMVVVAAQERRMISKRVSTAMQYIKSKGELKTRPKFGERRTGRKREFEEDPAAIEVLNRIREIKKDYPEISWRYLATLLNEEFDPSAFGKNKFTDKGVKIYCTEWEIS
jgi:DNA invertase Pin-like site-specific DNA recombinase